MKKSTVMLGAIFGTLLMGCSDEEIANVETSSRNAIGFNVLSNAAETRATPTTNTNLKNTDFDVFAFTADGTAFMGKNDTEFEHDGVKIVYKNGKWDYDDANDLRYWPTEALDFYAFNPGTVSEDMMMNYMWEASGTVQKISYTCIDEYGANTGHANYDVMYAMAKGQTKDMNNGIVKFNFKHILSQVVFKAKTQYDNMQVDINMIKIHNVKMGGFFTLPATADGTGSWSDPADLPSEVSGLGKFTVVKDVNITVKSNTIATDISTTTPMLNRPQELTAWKVSETATKSKLEADNAKQCYLEIACKIRQSGAYLLGSASEYKTIYVPFGDTWEQGKRHIYTLIFGGGYDDQGEAVLNPIQFDAETTGWVDADKDVNVQP
ncbi:fimbrillin family protein [Parabacteroides merdae]|uniref:fimbrillin family protein n=1 Tax=Bacteroides TaxID=816 RepID=UPI0018A0BC2A|nr:MULTISPECIES: fimbrillin family protein [Bacteroides]MDB8961572.1 fimbrillin family protein [Parabacteroides merdae]MDB8966643.1 fimbrillin family protein [Parabacteroides merdae]MDB8968827.1 fimbrillin family protein [Parabacteroides merdae]MDB8972891.1 fimbrillin family protein [Parabacteroides merdae]MDB8977280.1 fimbrillin family protein [Parabacteroides merdae]